VAAAAFIIELRPKEGGRCYIHRRAELILDTPEHEDSEYINFKIGRRSLLYQLF
jgi:hypothetical protein